MAYETRLSSGVPEYNVLLLGESGAGKSTFINAFGLYLQHETCEKFPQDQLKVVVPTKFSVNDDYKTVIEVNERNEGESDGLQAGESETTCCSSYLFRFDRYAIRLIDTPGMGSTVLEKEDKVVDAHAESVEKDKANVEEIVSFISNFDQLHAIAVILKGNETRYTPRFNYCLKSVMNNLHKSAIDKLVFPINFSSQTNYGIPEGLKERLEKITSENLNADRLLTFDHKGFQYLLSKKHGARYKPLNEAISEKCWKKSRKSCLKFLELVVGKENSDEIKPYPVQDTISIIDARKFVKYMEPVVRGFLQVPVNNEDPQSELGDQSLKYLHALYYSVPKVIKLDQPITICHSPKCYETNRTATEDKTACCNGCWVSGSNSIRRLFCSMFELKSGNCKACGCHVSHHQRMYYKMYEVDTRDDLEKIKLDNKKKQLDNKKKQLDNERKQLDNEILKIESAMAQFKDFLKTNPIFSEEFENHNPLERISPANVYAIRDELFNLKKYGPEIKKAYDINYEGEKNDSEQCLKEEKVIVITCNYSNVNLNFSSNSKSPLAPTLN